MNMEDNMAYVSPSRTSSPTPEGVKWDSGKPDYSLLPWKALDGVVRVLTYGAAKYSRDNWRRVPQFRDRYLAASLRHITAWAGGEERDPESGIHHLAHAVVSLMYLIQTDEERNNDPGIK
jgi:hypothetical protein